MVCILNCIAIWNIIIYMTHYFFLFLFAYVWVCISYAFHIRRTQRREAPVTNYVSHYLRLKLLLAKLSAFHPLIFYSPRSDLIGLARHVLLFLSFTCGVCFKHSENVCPVLQNCSIILKTNSWFFSKKNFFWIYEGMNPLNWTFEFKSFNQQKELLLI